MLRARCRELIVEHMPATDRSSLDRLLPSASIVDVEGSMCVVADELHVHYLVLQGPLASKLKFMRKHMPNIVGKIMYTQNSSLKDKVSGTNYVGTVDGTRYTFRVAKDSNIVKWLLK